MQWPIREIAFFLIEGSPRVEELARSYYDIRIWAAPATLMNYALLGWFIGLGRARMALVLQLVLNVTNMALDALFVLGLGLGVQGVGLGTLLAEMIAAAVGLAIAARHLRRLGGRWDFAHLRAGDRMRRTIAVNRDIMIRSAALIVAFAWFMAHSASQGDTILAANAVLMQFVTFAAFFLDGLAFAAEALIGKAVGAADRVGLNAAARLTTGWAAGVAAAACMVFAVTGGTIIDLLSVDEGVRATARIYLPWAVVTPLVSVWAFQLDGIFVGATRTAEMRNAMLAALVIFLHCLVAADAVAKPRALGGALRSLCGARRHSGLLLPGAGAVGAGVTAGVIQVQANSAGAHEWRISNASDFSASERTCRTSSSSRTG